MYAVDIYSDAIILDLDREHYKQMLNKTRHIFALVRNTPNIFIRESASSIFRDFFLENHLLF